MTGADEHGQKIAETAGRQGLTPKQLCDQYVSKFQARARRGLVSSTAAAADNRCGAPSQELNLRLNISNDVYNRTTSAVHHECCQLIFRKSLASGDIYLGSYEGWCAQPCGAARVVVAHVHVACQVQRARGDLRDGDGGGGHGVQGPRLRRPSEEDAGGVLFLQAVQVRATRCAQLRGTCS